MNFKCKLIALSVAATVTQLTACGGGGSAAETPVIEPAQPDPVPTQSISGATADGYLVGAKVCLDLNQNAICEDEEPSTTTEAGGVYQFTDISADIDLSQTALLVEVIPGVTIDEDNPGEPLTKRYSMSAPVGVMDFISPMTTLVGSVMQEDSSLTQEEAETIISQRIGVTDDNIDIMADYVAEKVKNGGQSEYARVHKISQVIANVIADAIENADTGAGTTIDANEREIVRAVKKEIAENIQEITQAVDTAIENNADINIEDIVEIVTNIIDITVDNIQEQVNENREQREENRTQFQEQIVAGGIFILEGEAYKHYDEANNICIVERDIGYEHAQVVENTLAISPYYYAYHLNEFAAVEQEESELTVVWQDGNWQEANKEMTVSEVNEDGSLVISSALDGEQKIWANSVNIQDKTIAKYTDKQSGWEGLYDDDALFSEGALAYNVKIKQLNDVHILPIDEGCLNVDANTAEWCNVVYTNDRQEIATQFSQIITPEITENNEQDALIYLTGNQEYSIAVSLFGDVEADTGDMKVFKIKHTNCDAGYCQERYLLETTSWTKNERGLELNLPSKIFGWFDHEELTPTLTIFEGAIRRSFTRKGGNVDVVGWTLNDVAMENVLSQFDPENLHAEQDAKFCGIKEDDKDDDAEDKGDSIPEILHDEVTARALIGQHYYIADDDFRGLIYFDIENQLTLWSEERDSEIETDIQQADWKIDIEGQLIIVFDEEDWFHARVMSDVIGGDMMEVKEYDGDDYVYHTLVKASVITPEQLVEAPNFILTSEVQENCSITFNTGITADNFAQQQGGGYADLTNCESRIEGAASMFDFQWFTAQNGAIEIITYQQNEAGEAVNNQFQLFWLHSDSERVLSVMQGNTEEIPDEFFETFVFEPITE